MRSVRGNSAYASGYDPNGNMTYRCASGSGLVFTWDEEDRLSSQDRGTGNVATFAYDGDGKRVKTTRAGVTTVYIGGYHEYTNGIGKKYSYHWGRWVVMNDGGMAYWLLGDNLGSTSVAYKQSDGTTPRQRYYVWGAIRSTTSSVPTD